MDSGDMRRHEHPAIPGAGQVPVSTPAIGPPTPVSALILARKQLDNDTTTTWLLVALCAASAFYFSTMGIFVFTQGMISSLFSGQHVGVFGSIGVVGSLIIGIAICFIGPVLVVLTASRAHKRQYDWITAELVHGDLALMLIDESFGRMIQEWREARFQLRGITGGEVHLGNTFALRLIHFAAYSQQYFRMAMGQREFKITPATPLNCMADGLALGCLTCVSSGCLAWFTVILPLRIIYTYPRAIATRRAALDYFSGKWDLALEKKYIHRPEFSRAGQPAASEPADSPPPP